MVNLGLSDRWGWFFGENPVIEFISDEVMRFVRFIEIVYEETRIKIQNKSNILYDKFPSIMFFMSPVQCIYSRFDQKKLSSERGWMIEKLRSDSNPILVLVVTFVHQTSCWRIKTFHFNLLSA